MTQEERANNYIRMWVERLRKLTPEELTKREDPKKGYPPPMKDYPNVIMWDYAPGGRPTRVYDFTLDDIVKRMSQKTLPMRKAIKGKTLGKLLNHQREDDPLGLGDYPFEIRRWDAKWYNLIGDSDFWTEEPESWPSIYDKANAMLSGKEGGINR